MKRILSVLAALVLAVGMSAQSLRVDESTYHWESGAMFGFNNDGYEWDFRVAYFPISYFGIRLSLGMAGEIPALEDWDFGDYFDDDYYYDDYWDDDNYAARLKFNPAFVFRTPSLFEWKAQGASFHLFAEPGMVMAPRASGARGAKWLCWDMKAGINMQIDRCVFTLGYGVSNFSLYSGYPFSEYGVPEKDNYITHTGFIAMSYKF